MARFLIAVWPFAGHYFPLIAIAHALRAGGHEVAFYTGEKARAAVEGEGFERFPLRGIDEDRVDTIMYSQSIYGSRSRPGQLQGLLQEWLLGTLPAQVTDLRELVRSWRPDVLVAETSMLGPILVLRETEGIPVAVFSTVVACMLSGPDAPPFGLGLPAPRTPATRFLAALVRRANGVVGRRFRQAADDLRAGYGLPALPVSVTDYAGQMPLYLVPGIREFDYGRRDLPPSVHYIGPCIWHKPGHEPPPAWLAELDAARLDGGRPVVHVTEGTMHTSKPIVLRAAAQALGGRPLDVIMTTGGNRAPADLGLGEVAANIRVEGWLAHSDLLPKTDLIVTTGGAGTVMAALLEGVPLIVVPTEYDKAENAQRVAAAGVGLRLPVWRCSPRTLGRAVDRILSQPSFRAQARQMSALLRQQDGPHRAATLLAALAQSAPVSTAP